MTNMNSQFQRPSIVRPRTTAAAPLTAAQVARAYGFPTGVTGVGYTAGIIELGGGYRPADIAAYFTGIGIVTPTFIDVQVGDGANNPDGPNGADGEVQLDMIVAATVAPDALYRVYFAGNTDTDFLTALTQATQECDGVSISWGASENNWSPQVMDQFAAVIADARRRGVPVFVAAGDTGSTDSSHAGDQCDFPASAPDAIGCGGTRLLLAPDETRASETVWDDDDRRSATGGGVSRQFPGRQVPDIAGNADPDTGYQISIDGQPSVIGGTSAVAPLMLGLHALLWQAAGGATFDLMNLIATNPQACFDVTSGDNGAYRAGPGRDNTTGWGVPDGTLLLAALRSGIPAPVPPAPTPPAPPAAPPAPTPNPVPTATPVTLTGTFTGIIDYPAGATA